jgi:hypothetical protein
LDPRPSHGLATNLIDEAIKMASAAEQLELLGYRTVLVVGVPLLNELRIRVGSHIQIAVGGWKERQVFDSCLRRWDLAAVDEWQTICDGDKEWTERYGVWLKSVLQLEFSFDVAFVWGANASLVAAVNACGRTAIAVREGPVSKPLPELLAFALNKTPNGLSPVLVAPSYTRPLNTYRAQQILANVDGDLLAFENLEGEWNTYIADLLEVDKRYSRRILYVGEARDSPGLRPELEADQIGHLINLCAANDALLLIKSPENLSDREVNERHWRALSRKWQHREHIIELGDFPERLRPALMASVSGVVSLSSSVIFEAMLFDLPVHNAMPSYFFPDQPLLSLNEVVTGQYSKGEYRDKIALVRDVVLRTRVVVADTFFSSDGAGQLLSRLNISGQISVNADHLLSDKHVRMRRPPAKILQGVTIGKFVYDDNGDRILELDNGNRFTITSGVCIGEVSALELSDDHVVLEGWAYIKDTRAIAPFFVIQYREGSFLVSSSVTERLDIAAAHEDEALRLCGFEFTFNIGDIDLEFLRATHVLAYHGHDKLDRIKWGATATTYL